MTTTTPIHTTSNMTGIHTTDTTAAHITTDINTTHQCTGCIDFSDVCYATDPDNTGECYYCYCDTSNASGFSRKCGHVRNAIGLHSTDNYIIKDLCNLNVKRYVFLFILFVFCFVLIQNILKHNVQTKRNSQIRNKKKNKKYETGYKTQPTM